MELVTIILTTLNSQKFLARSLESCLRQTYENIEVIIVDGGSTDRTLDIIASCDDPRLRVIEQQNNEGKLPGAINLGMAYAMGEYMTWTQDDSWFELCAIETMLVYLRTHPDVGLVYADYWDVDDKGHVLQYQHVGTPDQMLRDDVVRQCFLFRREVYEVIGPQDTRFFPVHEVPWRMKVAQRFRMEPLHVPLLSYTVHGGSLTGKIGNRALRRQVATIFKAQGLLDNRSFRRRLAEIDITEAYEAYRFRGDYKSFVTYAVHGIMRDPRWLRNRGLLKLILASLGPLRKRYRQAYLVSCDLQNPGSSNVKS